MCTINTRYVVVMVGLVFSSGFMIQSQNERDLHETYPHKRIRMEAYKAVERELYILKA